MIKAARPVAAPSPSSSPSRPPPFKRTPTPAMAPSSTPTKPFPTPTTASTASTTPAGAVSAPPQPVSLSGVWLLDVRRSDSVVPLYEYHHVPYSASAVDRDQWIMHIEQRSDRLTIHFYILAAAFPLASFSLSSPAPSYSTSYPITSHTAATAFHPVRLPHRSTTARCYPAPHLRSLLVDTSCQSKYDLERRELYLAEGGDGGGGGGGLVEEVRVLSCDPTVPDGGGRKGAGVATVFAAGLEGKEVVARNKTIVKELLMLKRVWTRWDGGKRGAGSGVGADDVKEKGKAKLDVTGRDQRKKLSDVKEDDEGDGTEDSARKLLFPPSAAGARGRSPASTPSSSPSASPIPPRSRSPSPLPPDATIRSPSPLPALTSASMPLPNLTGVYVLDKKRSQSLAPLLARYRIRAPTTAWSAAARLKQCKQGIKPSPSPLLPPTLYEIIRLSCTPSTIATTYYVAKQWPNLALSAYPLGCFTPVAAERFTADGTKRAVQSDLHPTVQVRCAVKEGGIVVVEAEGEVDGAARGGRWRESSELRRVLDGVELVITRLEAGKQPLVVRRCYQAVSGLALDAVQSEHEAAKEHKMEASVARKDSVERDGRAMQDDSAKVIEQPLYTKAEAQDDEEPDETAVIEPMRLAPTDEQRVQPTTAIDTAADTEVTEEQPLGQVDEHDDEQDEAGPEQDEEQKEAEQAASLELDEEQVAEGKESQPLVEAEQADEQPAQEEVATQQPITETITQPAHTIPAITVVSTQRPAAVPGTKRAASEEKRQVVETTSSRVQTVQKQSEVVRQPATDVQQAMWRRKDVWMVAFLAVLLLVVWHTAGSR